MVSWDPRAGSEDTPISDDPVSNVFSNTTSYLDLLDEQWTFRQGFSKAAGTDIFDILLQDL